MQWVLMALHPMGSPLDNEQRRVDLATFRALPASTWGHCSQVLCFTIVWDTPEKKKVAKWSPAPASILEGFNEIYVVYGPKNPYKTREKRQSCQFDPCLPPYNGFVCIVRPFPPLKKAPPLLVPWVTMGGPTHLWVGPPISSTH